MIYRTKAEALRQPGQMASWKATAVVAVRLRDGRQFFRTYVFDQYAHKCKRCRRAAQPGRLAASGNTCDICGNPFAAFVRRGVRKTGAGYVRTDAWTGSGKLH